MCDVNVTGNVEYREMYTLPEKSGPAREKCTLPVTCILYNIIIINAIRFRSHIIEFSNNVPT